jgi:hypothetical protein
MISYRKDCKGPGFRSSDVGTRKLRNDVCANLLFLGICSVDTVSKQVSSE